MSGGG
jgi:predicted acylesterase/phospholipase RssA